MTHDQDIPLRLSDLIRIACAITLAIAAIVIYTYPISAEPAPAPDTNPCGPNATWKHIDSTTVQCFNKRGQKTTRKTL